MDRESIREETENQLIAILSLHNELIDFVQVRPNYLKSKANQIILNSMIECFKKYHTFSKSAIYEFSDDFPYDVYVEILNKQLVLSNYLQEFFILENKIVDYYKEDIIANLSKKLANKEINYHEFVTKINKLQEIEVVTKTEELTKTEILNNISDENVQIYIRNFDKLNQKLKLVQGDFLIVGATTGAGKSGLLLNFMNGLMDDYQCIYFNMEMSKSTIYKRIISIRSGVPISYLSRPTEYQKELIDEAIKQVENNKIIIDHQAVDVNHIKALVKKVKNPNKHTILFIDHLGLIKSDGKKSLYEQATEVSKELRQICLTYDCTIISASQLNRSAYTSDEISLSMLKDSGELENSASKVILLYREKNQTKENPIIPMYLDIAKNRDGQIGIIKTDYDRTKQIFTEKRDF